MKKVNYILLLFILFTALANTMAAQKDSAATSDTTPPAPEEIIKLRYFNDNNKVQYIILEGIIKTGKERQPLVNKSFAIYLDSVGTATAIGTVSTGKDGKAKSFLPPSLKSNWDAAGLHTFIAVPAGKEDETAAELEITKSKIEIDTATSEEGKKSITVKVQKFETDTWVAVPDVEMKVGIQRLGSILSAGDDATYTTDSSGTATVELTKDSLPGDAKGNVLLAAKVEDNDVVGNLLIQQSAPWGVVTKYDNSFFSQRTLWSTQFKTPIWLLLMAYTIVLSVWGTLIYLILQMIKIKKLGKTTSA
jgi:hypothetical protein